MAMSCAAPTADSFFFQIDGTAFEFHAIKVISLPENRNFNTIKLFTVSRELIYLRREGLSIPENHTLLIRGPKVPVLSSRDEATIVIGDENWDWLACFDDYKYPKFGVQSVVVKDPQFPEAAVEIIFEKIEKPAQAHFNIRFKDNMNKDRQIKITRGVISAIANRDDRTKRVLRCFGDDLVDHMLPSEKTKRDLAKLVSEESIDLYRSHMVMPANSDFSIVFDLELEIVTDGDTRPLFIRFENTVSSKAPAKPNWIGKKDFITYATEKTKETTILEIDDFAEIQVDISWFNDDCAALQPDNDHTLWGYRDGDCDYKGYNWADRQEIDWDNLHEVEMGE